MEKCANKAKKMLKRLNEMPFPAEEMGMLGELAALVGTKDVALLCAVCFLYGMRQAEKKDKI